MMRFRALKQSIIDNVLVPFENGRFVTIGCQRQRKSSDEINLNRHVTVYYSEGEMPKNASASYGSVAHDATFRVELSVASNAALDLSTVNSSTATESDKSAALRQMLESGVVADEKLDELIEIVWNVLMDGRNEQMGLEPPADRPNLKLVSNRWVDTIRKDAPQQDGENTLLTASMRLVCRIAEDITGADLPSSVAEPVFNNTLNLDQ